MCFVVCVVAHVRSCMCLRVLVCLCEYACVGAWVRPCVRPCMYAPNDVFMIIKNILPLIENCVKASDLPIGIMGPVEFDGNADRLPGFWLWGIGEHGDSFQLMAEIHINAIQGNVSTKTRNIELVNVA